MQEIAVALLRVPTGEFVLQRRSQSASTSRGMLGLFGGHLEIGEEPEGAIQRELKEETSLSIGELVLKYETSQDIPSPEDPSVVRVRAHVFGADIPDASFRVYEGDGAEAYQLEDLIERSDTSPTARYIIGLVASKQLL